MITLAVFHASRTQFTRIQALIEVISLTKAFFEVYSEFRQLQDQIKVIPICILVDQRWVVICHNDYVVYCQV